MKRLILTLSIIGYLFAQPSPEGNWKLSGLEVDYMHIAREDVSVTVCDTYGQGFCVEVAAIPTGVYYTVIPKRYSLEGLANYGVNLNVNVYPGGTGAIAQGSNYPDVNIIEDTCIPDVEILPVEDSFSWETAAGDATAFASVNVLGLASANELAGSEAWGFGVTESTTFDSWTSYPVPNRLPEGLEYIADTAGNLLAYSCTTAVLGGACAELGMAPGDDCVAALMGAGAWAAVEGNITTCEMYCNPAYGGGFGGACAAGFGNAGWLNGSGGVGYFNLNQGESQVTDEDYGPNVDEDGNLLDVDFLLEWNGIDGPVTGSGFGDDPDVDEDGDGLLLDREFSIPYITVTPVGTGPECDITGGSGLSVGYIAGDIVSELGGSAALAGFLTGGCIGSVQDACYEGGGGTALVYGGCLDTVSAGLEAQCDAAGGPVNAVTGLCIDASQGDDFAAGCAYYGAAASVFSACSALGFDDETCTAAGASGEAAVNNYCDSISGYPGLGCAAIGVDPCSVLTNIDFATGLCFELASTLTTSETCSEFADSFDSDFLNDAAAQVLGVTCADYAGSFGWGELGDTTVCASTDWADAFAVNVIGTTCSGYGAGYEAMCIGEVTSGNDMYLLDLSLEQWGLFFTYHGAYYSGTVAACETAGGVFNITYGGCLQQGLDEATCAGAAAAADAGYGGSCAAWTAGEYPYLMEDDSDHDFDPTCYYTDPTSCSGRIPMGFAPTCLNDIEARQIVAEFQNLEELCNHTGDANLAGDGLNVQDVVTVVNHILAIDADGDGEADNQLGGVALCEADVNEDNIVNVMDVVSMVNSILGIGFNSQQGDLKAIVKYSDNEITVESDNFVSGVELTISHCEDFSLELPSLFVSDYNEISENVTKLILVTDDYTESISKIADIAGSCDITINNIVIVGRSGSAMDTLIEELKVKRFAVKPAYPNPFNPTTTINLELMETANISVKIYNVAGQLVDVIANGLYTPRSYSWTWNAENLASGVYFVTQQVGSDIHTEKIMLLK